MYSLKCVHDDLFKLLPNPPGLSGLCTVVWCTICVSKTHNRPGGLGSTNRPGGLGLNLMKELVKLWMDGVAFRHNLYISAEWPSAHTSKAMQEQSLMNLLKFWVKEERPPSSQDCNIWSILSGAFARPILTGHLTKLLNLCRARSPL